MGLFGKKKIIDLTERYKVHQEKLAQLKSEENSDMESPVEETASEKSVYSESDSAEEKRKKLARRLSVITERLDDLSSQLYRLQQRVELIEKKMSG